jgi:hypothetical protein
VVTANGTKARKGFRIPDQTAHLTFSGTDYDGAEIWVRLNVSFRHYIALREAAEGDDQAKMAALFGGDVLMSWNLEDDAGQPIPANGEGMLEIPLSLAMLVVQHWVEAVSGVSSPLPETSGDINMLEAASTAMETE